MNSQQFRECLRKARAVEGGSFVPLSVSDLEAIAERLRLLEQLQQKRSVGRPRTDGQGIAWKYYLALSQALMHSANPDGRTILAKVRAADPETTKKLSDDSIRRYARKHRESVVPNLDLIIPDEEWDALKAYLAKKSARVG